MMASSQNSLSPEKNRNHDLSNSNIFDRDNFDKIRQEKEHLLNENNTLKKKIQSLVTEAAKGDPLLVKKNEELSKENFTLRKEI